MNGKAGRSTGEYSRMIQGKKTGEIQLSEIEHLLKKDDPFARSTAVQAIARVGGREAYDKLIDIIRRETERDVINSAIIALAQVKIAPDTKDSRALFPLVNIYNSTEDYQAKVNVLNALAELNDPRAIDFLRQLKETEKKDLHEIIDGCINAQDASKRFVYAFTKADESDLTRIEAQRIDAEKTDKHRLQIRHYSDIPALPIHFRDLRITDGMLGPLTYILDEKERLFIGTEIEEHVITARGANVIAAGEMTFMQNGDNWEIVELNNRSNGYFPARNTYTLVAKVLDAAGIKHPEQFTYLHPRDGFFADDFLVMFPFHPKYEDKYFGKKRKKN